VGSFFDANSRTLTYQATPPASETGVKTFAGVGSFDGTSLISRGESSIDVIPLSYPTSGLNDVTQPDQI